jgi:tyrosine-protein phosphatase SIW14
MTGTHVSVVRSYRVIRALLVLTAAAALLNCSERVPKRPANFAVVEAPSATTRGKYRGGRPSPQEIAALRRDLQVKTMIRLNRGNASADRNAARLASVHLIEIPLNPKLVGSSDPATRAGVEQAFLAFTDPKNGPVYIYCDRGRDRTGFVVALYRARIQRWSLARIRTELARHGHGAVMQRYLPDITRQLAREARREPDIGMSAQSMTSGD